MKNNDKVLYNGEWIKVIDRDGYQFAEESKCPMGRVAVLAYTMNPVQFLVFMENCPAHDKGRSEYSIAGSLDKLNESPSEAARRELFEEGGFQVESKDLIDLGVVYPSKGASEKVYLFAVDIAGLEQKKTPKDGSDGESKSYPNFISLEKVWFVENPVFLAMVARLKAYQSGLFSNFKES